MWFAKIQTNCSTDIMAPTQPVVPTVGAMAAMLSPLTELCNKTKCGMLSRKRRKRTTLVSARQTLHQLKAAPSFGPIQPPRRLTLPRPDSLSVRSESFCPLLPRTWLDDQIIHAYLALLQNRNPDTMYLNLILSQYLPPHRPVFDYATVRHMYTNIDLFIKDLILMPINIGNTHWT